VVLCSFLSALCSVLKSAGAKSLKQLASILLRSIANIASLGIP
jgi:hypothetical protein